MSGYLGIKPGKMLSAKLLFWCASAIGLIVTLPHAVVAFIKGLGTKR